MRLVKWLFRIVAIVLFIGVPLKAYLEKDCWPMALFAGFLVGLTTYVVTTGKDFKNV